MFGSKSAEGWRGRFRELLGRFRSESIPENELEALFYEADFSPALVERLKRSAISLRGKGRDDVLEGLQAEIVNMAERISIPAKPLPHPGVILLIGVNGAGKTTVAGRLAWRLRKEGTPVVLAAGDTFRAGAVEQLRLWGERTGAEVVSQKPGADPAAVVYDAWKRASALGAVLIADTAGRLHTKMPLVEELRKVIRVLQKDDPTLPHETYLVLDATTGQNALVQAREFLKAAPVTGLIVTKLDGTAKGGAALSAAIDLNLPIRFLGLGEKPEDLEPFDSLRYAKGLLQA